MRVKRYALIALIGGLLLLLGVVQLTWDGPLVSGFFQLARWAVLLNLPQWLSGLFWMAVGILLVFLGIRWMNRSVLSALADPDTVPEQVYIRRRLENGPRIVALGGGTGLSRVLSGLKQETANITAIVAATDDGGSTGRLRTSFGIPAVGDLVDCLAALSDAEGLPNLMQYRFARGGELKGHTFGNLMLVSLYELEDDFATAIREANGILRLRGAVWPATSQPAKLWAIREDGSREEGESSLRHGQGRILQVGLEPAEVPAMPEALEALRRADLIVLGPGSLYTSVIPSFLPSEIAQAIRQSSAKVCYIANVMTEVGETDHLSVYEHYQAVAAHLGRRPDIVLVHTAPIDPELLARYGAENQEPVALDLEALEATGVRVIQGDFLEKGPYAQHDPGKLVRALIALC
ncbi:MAG TPA: gluconeogenesis factor YvcK family protein [Meiothermus sp.]|nr:gluconeogenesis factor YvcK family protein [Meiothermus sp.]